MSVRQVPIDPSTLNEPLLRIDSWGRRHVSLAPAIRLRNSIPNWGESGDVCWVWTAGVSPRGYGRISIDGKPIFAHRVSYALHFDCDPGQLSVLHRCDNPPCCNPDHLFLGTYADNAADMVSKGRNVAPTNEWNGRAKISKKQVEQLRERADSGEAYSSLARDFGIHPATVSRIARRLRRVS